MCDEAADGQEAVAKFSRGKFDAVVIDFQMPVMNGLEAAKQISSPSPETPILMITMHTSSHLAAEAVWWMRSRPFSKTSLISRPEQRARCN